MGLPSKQEELYYERLRQSRRRKYYHENEQALVFPDISFIGDSLIELFPIKQLLDSSSEMVNRGISASRTDHILAFLDCHIFGDRLQQIFLLIGTNDLGYGIDPQIILEHVKAIIDGVLDHYPFAKVQLLEILPVSHAPEFATTVGLRTNSDIQMLNKAYNDLVQSYLNVDTIATFEHFVDYSGQLDQSLTVDGLHLNLEGYERLASLIQPYL